MEEITFTMKEFQENIKKLNSGTMHEVDQLTLMCDTQRYIIRLLQQQIRNLKVNKNETIYKC